MELIRTRVGLVLGDDRTRQIGKSPEIDSHTGNCADSSLTSNTEEMNEVAIVEETIAESCYETHSESRIQSDALFETQLEGRIETEDHVVLEDDDLFHGFSEPFETESDSQNVLPSSNRPSAISIGSDQWSRGLITGSDGRIVHVSQLSSVLHRMPFIKSSRVTFALTSSQLKF